MKKTLYFLAIFAILFTSCSNDDEIIESEIAVEMEVVTSKPSSTIKLSLTGTNTIVDWGDGNIQKFGSSGSTSIDHTYEASKAYKIRITDENLQSFGVENNEDDAIKYVKFVKCPSLRFVRLLQAKSLYSIDFSSCPVLQEVYITRSALTSLDLTNNNSIQSVKLLNNAELASLKLGSKVKTLGLVASPKLSITNIGLSQLIALEDLFLNNMNIESIDLNANVAISSLDVSENNLQTLDISKLAGLKKLVSADNKLTQITLGEANTKLTDIDCTYNLLESIALNNIYTALPARAATDAAKIAVTGNAGANDSDETIATAKNWSVSK